MRKVLIIGPAHPLRGGLATFNHRLAKEFLSAGWSCEIVSFSLQYPSLLFPGTSQYTDEPAPENIVIHSWINSINPLNWLRTGKKLKKQRPDLIVVRFWLPFMGPALGTILRQVKKNQHTKIICIADNVIPHEKRPGDSVFTKYFLNVCDGFVIMSQKVLDDLKQFEPNKPARLVQHPLYDNFGEKISKAEARSFLKLDQQSKIILFFGFIRKYKGLDLLLQAMAQPLVKQSNVRLLIAGEFYEEQQPYLQLIKDQHIEESIILRTQFISDSEVKYYLCAADCVVQPYRNATQSGVTPLAYHFEKPMIVTNVGGLPSLVPHKRAGLVCEPQPDSIAAAIEQFYQLGEEHFLPNLQQEKQKFTWRNLLKAIEDLTLDPSPASM